MNSIRPLLPLFLVLATLASAAAPPKPDVLRRHLFPAKDAREVLTSPEEMEYLPVSELERLLAQRHERSLRERRETETQEKEAAARSPAQYIVHESRVEGEVAPDSAWCRAKLSAEIELPGPAAAWVSLLSGSVVVGPATLDGQPVALEPSLSGGELSAEGVQQQAAPAPESRELGVKVPQAGRHSIEVEFACRVGEDGFYRVTRFGLPGQPAPVLALTVPGKEIHAALQPPCKVDAQPGKAEGTTRLEARLTPSPELVLRWVEVDEKQAPAASTEPEPVATAPAGPPRLDASVLQVFDAGEKGLAGQFHAWVRARVAAVSQLELRIPAGIQAPTLAWPRNWTLEDPGPAGKARKVRLLAPEKFQGDVKLQVDFALETNPSGFALELPSPLLEGLVRQPGYVAITRSANLELACTPGKGVDATSVSELPAPCREALQDDVPLFLYRRPDPAGKVKLEGTRYQDAPVLAALVDEAQAWTACDSTGQLMGRIAYRFRSSGRETLTLDLKGCERTGIFLDGKTPAATQAAGSGGIQVSLAGVRPGQSAVLELRFRTTSLPLEWAGETEFALPAIDVPIRELDWQVYTPRGFTFTEYRGAEGLRKQMVTNSKNLLHPPDPAWPDAPVSLAGLGVAAGSQPRVRCLYLISPLSVYPVLMLFLFGGFLGYLARLVLLDGRGFGTAAVAAGLGTLLVAAYVPGERATGAALFSGFMLYVLLMVVTAMGRWLSGRTARPVAPAPVGPPPPPPPPPAPAVAAPVVGGESNGQ